MKLLRNIFLCNVILLIFFSFACGESLEEEKKVNEIDIVISGGIVEGEETVVVGKNQQVKLHFTSDQEMTVHLHGYDIEKKIPESGKGTIMFDAHATGRFPVTTHASDEDHSSQGAHQMHGMLFESATLRSGDTFSYKVDADFDHVEIPYHDHMSHKSVGIITVSSDVSDKDATITVKNDEHFFYPKNVTVRPGATVNWISQNPDKVRIISGNPPTDSHSSHNHAGHGKSKDSEGAERTLVTIEVHP